MCPGTDRTMMTKPTRVVVPIDDMDAESWHVAAGYAQEIALRTEPPVSELVLLTHSKAQLRGTSLEGHIGSGAAKALAAGRAADLGSGMALRHETLQTLRYPARAVVIIAFYADDRMLEFVDGLSRIAGVVAVPDLGDAGKLWRERWAPIVHGQANEPAAAPLIDDPVVVKALEVLSAISNLAHSVMHPRDKEHANETLRILRAKGHALDGGKIKSWAIRNDWKPGAAQELGNLATRVAGLKGKPSLAGFHDPQGRYARWQG